MSGYLDGWSEKVTYHGEMRPMQYLIGVSIILDISAASSALVVVEVPVGEGNSGELLPVCTEPASTRGVGAFSTTGSTHVVDDSVHIDVDLWVDGIVD